LYCGFPTEDERVEILGLYLLKLNKDNSEETMSAIKEIAEKTENYSSADLQNIVNEAHLMAIHEVKDLDKVESIRVSSSNLINSFKKSKKSVVEADIQYFKKYNKNFREKIEEDTILKMREQRTTLY
jgi:SpoVK/Ycf46/Vps4 family AAA+-type ATPase